MILYVILYPPGPKILLKKLYSSSKYATSNKIKDVSLTPKTWHGKCFSANPFSSSLPLPGQGRMEFVFSIKIRPELVSVNEYKQK